MQLNKKNVLNSAQGKQISNLLNLCEFSKSKKQMNVATKNKPAYLNLAVDSSKFLIEVNLFI